MHRPRLMWVFAMFAAAAVCAGDGAPPDPSVVAEHARSLMSDDSHERITAVVELEKLGSAAAPALPAMRAALAREDDPGVKGLMIKAIASIEDAIRNAKRPTDIRAHAERVHALIAKLHTNADRRSVQNELARLGAIARPVVAAAEDNPELTVDECRVIINKAMWELTGDLASDSANVRIRAIRDLAPFGAAAEPALATLARVAESDANAVARKLAGRAIAVIEREVEVTKSIRDEQK